MECNKDEAIRAKDIAVRKFTEKDYTGARKFALKAQTLYPGLEGISQMLSTINVYISADNKSGGEKDLYGILGVNPLADDDTIKKQYRRLVLQLHPDKNKSVGADGAFLLVTEAFNVLSDKTKRSAYNTTRHIKIAQKVTSQTQATYARPFDPKVPTGGVSSKPCYNAFQQKPPSGSGIPSGPHNVNGWGKRPTPSYGKSQTSATRKQSEQFRSFFTEVATFWTVCTRCKMQYEYVRSYLGQFLRCPNCSAGFVAVEISPPSNLAPLQPDKLNQGPSGVNISVDGRSTRWRPFPGSVAAGQGINKSHLKKESLKRAGKTKREGHTKKSKQTNGCFVPAVAL